jgi:hypothetical protein
MITPGAAAGKDAWWNGENTMKQAMEHLEAMCRRFPDVVTCDVYDNSTGHGCMAKDALSTDKINLKPGYARKGQFCCRPGYHKDHATGARTYQSMKFKAGDILAIDIKKDAKLSNVRIIN